MLDLTNKTAKQKAQLKSKMSDYWHKEIYILIPVIVVWTILLAIIAMK